MTVSAVSAVASYSEQVEIAFAAIVAKWKQYALLITASTAWMFFSSALILLNKYLMVADGFRYPMALTGMGMAFSSIASFLVCKVSSMRDPSQPMTLMPASTFLTRMMPVGLCLALTLALGNWVYLYLTVAFIQMLKGSTPIVTMVLTFLVGIERPGRNLILSVLMIAGGVVLAAYGEINFSLMGVGIMFATQVAESMRLVMTQILLQGFKLSPFEGLMYTAPACVFWLLLGFILMEYGEMREVGAFQKILEKPVLYFSSAAMGFLMHLSAYFALKLSGSLTLKVLGTVKNSLIVLSGVMLFGEQVSRVQLEGYTISVIGFFLYNQAKLAAKPEGDKSKSDRDPASASTDEEKLQPLRSAGPSDHR